jgi:tetratricopeptide (TPR) repeat protein
MKPLLPLTAILVLVLAGSALAEPDNLSAIERLVADGRNYAAEKKLEAMVEKKATDPAAWALLAQVRLNMADLEGAGTAILKALDLVKDQNPGYWKLFGRIAFETGIQAYSQRLASSAIKSHFADAETRFTEAKKQNDKDPEIRWLLGWAKEWQEYPKRAIALYKEQIEMFPNEAGGYRRYGAMISTEANGLGDSRNAAAKEKRDQALKLFDTGLEKAGPDAEIYYLRGLALEWALQRPEAKKSYRSAAKTDPSFDKAWRRLYDLKEPVNEILDLALAVLKKDKTNATAAKWAGFALTAAKETEKAMDLMLKSLEVHREDYGLWFQASATAGGWYRNPATKAKTIPWFERIHEYYPFSGGAANNIGLYHRDVTGNYKESARWYVMASEREPNNQDTLNDTGLIFLFHFRGAEQKKCLPYLTKTIELVTDDGQTPIRGFWDACENLCKYYWEVDRQPKLVIKYAEMRNTDWEGTAPYVPSQRVLAWKRLAEKELGK